MGKVEALELRLTLRHSFLNNSHPTRLLATFIQKRALEYSMNIMQKAAYAVITAGLISVSPAYAKEQKPAKVDQLELCGAFARTAPWCGEALEGDSSQIEAAQIFTITVRPDQYSEWIKIHQEKRRGITFTKTNDQGHKIRSGRPVINALARVIAVPPDGNMEGAMLFQALLSPDLKTATPLLDARQNYIGWHVYLLSSEGKHALLVDGTMIKLGGRHRTDGNMTLELDKLPQSRVISTTLVSRGDGTGLMEMLESTFIDHKTVHDQNGEIRVYSGLAGTFTPVSEDGNSVVGSYTNCRTAGQRLIERGNLRFDTGMLMTGPIGPAVQLAQNLKAVFTTSCR